MIRAEVLSPIGVIRSATLTGAELIMVWGKVGVIAPSAYADLITVEGDPLKDLSLLGEQGRYMSAIMKGGVFVENDLVH
jgi:imidazolonepropionase-like amidohydrolase